MNHDNSRHERLYRNLTLVIQAWLVVGFIVFLLKGDWENAFLTLAVIGLIVVPSFVLRRHRIYIPPEFQLIAAAFIFLSFFLGSARDFYYRFWWWDMVLHTTSGVLLGIVGWIMLFILNQTDHIPRGMKPGFVCFFAVTFAAFLGVVWEIFEFAVDYFWPQVNMMSHETGVTDTMQDLIVDLAGAVAVALMGYAYSRSGRYSFVVDGVQNFMQRNPRLFRKREKHSA